MESMLFFVLLFVTAFTTTKSLTIAVTSDVVTVREGEQLNLVCSITLNNQIGLWEVRWYRGTNQTPYGSIGVTNCGVSPLCPEVNTTDNRGVVNFTRGFLNDATLTLVIDHSLARDNTSFSCGVGLNTNQNTFQRSDNIYVIVQHLPDPTYPMCLRSNSSTPTDILSLSCWAEITLPVVSLEWTVEGSSSDQISLSNKTEIDEYRVENNLLINNTGIPSGSLVFTCHLTSWAFPHTQRNCSIGPILILGDQTTEGILPDATTTTPFAQDGTPTADEILTPNDSPLNTVVIAAIASACLVVIIILLIIIACLVSSRRKRSRAAPTQDPQDLSIRLSVAITSPGSNTNLFHEAHVYANQSDPATISSNNRPGNFELRPGDKTAPPPSPLYASVSSGEKVSHVEVGDGSSYAVVSKRDKRRISTPLEEDQPNTGHPSQYPPEYHTLEPGALQMTQGLVPKSTEGQVGYAVPRPSGQGARSQGSSELQDEEEGKLVDNILYASADNEYV